jgi:hypothetical protein
MRTAIAGRSIPGFERAQIVGDAFRQHRNDAVRKVHRIASRLRLAVECRAGPHVMRDVGDRHRDDIAAGICRVAVSDRMDRVVVVLGIGRIDGDERDLPPVLAAGEIDRARCFRFRDGSARERVRDAVGVNRDQAHGALGS